MGNRECWLRLCLWGQRGDEILRKEEGLRVGQDMAATCKAVLCVRLHARGPVVARSVLAALDPTVCFPAVPAVCPSVALSLPCVPPVALVSVHPVLCSYLRVLLAVRIVMGAVVQCGVRTLVATVLVVWCGLFPSGAA
ncbi:unnamed protein product [Closterium sp. NIES-65]|nr:unnamed protein product [Closterium sp. NIES-65]